MGARRVGQGLPVRAVPHHGQLPREPAGNVHPHERRRVRSEGEGDRAGVRLRRHTGAGELHDRRIPGGESPLQPRRQRPRGRELSRLLGQQQPQFFDLDRRTGWPGHPERALRGLGRIPARKRRRDRGRRHVQQAPFRPDRGQRRGPARLHRECRQREPDGRPQPAHQHHRLRGCRGGHEARVGPRRPVRRRATLPGSRSAPPTAIRRRST